MSSQEPSAVALMSECVDGSNQSYVLDRLKHNWFGQLSTIMILALLFGGSYSLQLDGWITSTVIKTQSITETDRVKLIDALNHAVADARYLSRSSSMPRGDNGLTESAKSKVAQDFIALGGSTGHYDQIRLISNEGHEVVRVNFEAGEGVVVKQSQLQNKFDRYYVTEGLKLSPTQIYISPFDLNIENTAVEKPYKPVIRLVSAVFDVSGRRQGIVVLNYLGKRTLTSPLNRTEEIGLWTSLVNGAGYWLYPPPGRQGWGFMFNRSPGFSTSYPAAWQELKHTDNAVNQSEQDILVASRISLEDDLSTEPSVELITDDFWYVISSIENRIIEAKKIELIGQLSLFFVPIILIIIILYIALLRSGKSRKIQAQQLRDSAERDFLERQRNEQRLKLLSDQITGKIGQDFIDSLVLGLADAFEAKYALVGLLNHEDQSVTTVSSCSDGKVIDNFTYQLFGSPCHEVLDVSLDNGGYCVVEHSAISAYPEDQFFRDAMIESYAGCAIYNSRGEAVGILVVMDTSPWQELTIKHSLLKIYASRVSTELERIEYEKALSLAATAFNTIEGIVVSDPHGTILKVNNAFSEITGYTEAEVVGRNTKLLESGRHDEAFYKTLSDELRSTGYWQGEIWNRRKTGEVYPEWLRVSAVKDDKGSVINYVGAFMDIHERMQQTEDIERRAAEETVIGQILQYGIAPTDQVLFLQHTLDYLVKHTPWIIDRFHSAIFIKSRTSSKLERVAGVNIDRRLTSTCLTVDMDNCHCGKAAKQLSSQFSPATGCSLIAKSYTLTQGSYAIPIHDSGALQGVLQIGVPTSSDYSQSNQGFLERVATVLSMGISRRESDEKLEYQAYHDSLTGLANRVLLQDRFFIANSSGKRRQEFIGLAFIDIDHFKKINDALGHSVGDALLKAIADRLKGCVRAEDTLARIGGDEFVILLPQLDTNELKANQRVESVTRKIISVFDPTFNIEGHELAVSCSIGAVVDESNALSYENLLKHADTAMYRAKSAGRGVCQFFQSHMQEAVTKRLELEKDLSSALDRNEFQLLYQPQVNSQGKVLSAEALIRWNRANEQIVSPLDFIPIAEDTGMIIAIGEWVIKTACELICELERSNISAVPISVNVSAKQFKHEGFITTLQQIIQQTGANPQLLGIELTESLLVEDVGKTRSTMNGIRELGIKISIDDFGTGYSGLSYLKDLPIDVLKVDRVFVKNIHLDTNSAAISEAILAMAKNLKMKVIVEGVEVIEEVAFFTDRGCDLFQGYFFSKPISVEQFTEFAQRSSDLHNRESSPRCRGSISLSP